VRNSFTNHWTLLLLLLPIWFVFDLRAQTGNDTTLRQTLTVNGIADLTQYSDEFLETKISFRPRERYARIPYHINPSAETLFVFSRNLKLVAELSGWELALLPDESVIYQRSQVHFAPTHSVELSIFNPDTRQDVQIYPPKPYQPVRRTFIERVALDYKRRGEEWFAKNNHHMNPEMFDSSLIGNVAVDVRSKAISFRVKYGDPENPRDPLPFSQVVNVTCAPIDDLKRLKCRELLMSNE